MVAQPGWYEDPWRPGDFRFWDGAGWTDRTRSRGDMVAEALDPRPIPVVQVEPRWTTARVLMFVFVGVFGFLLVFLFALAALG